MAASGKPQQSRNACIGSAAACAGFGRIGFICLRAVRSFLRRGPYRPDRRCRRRQSARGASGGRIQPLARYFVVAPNNKNNKNKHNKKKKNNQNKPKTKNNKHNTTMYWFLFLIFRFVIRREVGAV